MIDRAALLLLGAIAAWLPLAGGQGLEPLFAAFSWSLGLLTLLAALSVLRRGDRAVRLRVSVGVAWVAIGLFTLAGAALAMA